MKQITFIVFLFLFSIASFGQGLKITEIMYNPAGTDNPWEWIEIYNDGLTTIDLTGYVLDDASGSELATANILNGQLEPQKSIILFDADDITEAQFQEVWGTVNLIGVRNWPTLGNSGDAIGIWDSYTNYDGDHQTQLNTTEQVTYDKTDNGWPTDDGKASIHLKELDLDNTLGDNWSLSTEGGNTPINITYVSIELHDNSGIDVGSPGIPAGLEDTENPVISCPEDIVVSAEEDFCGASFPLLLPTATDNSEGELTFEGVRSDTLDLIMPYPVGETTITWTVSDETGNISEPCVQKITVTDDTPPTIVCANDIVGLSLDGSAVIVEIPDPMTTDICEGQVAIKGVRSDDLNLLAPYPVGETTILWQAKDVSENISECTQTILVTFVPSMANAIISFSIENQIGDTNIDEANKTITIEMPLGSDLMALAPSIEVSEFATVSPEPETPLDFSMPRIYTVTAQDGSTQEWEVQVILETDETPPTFEVSGNTTDFTTELEVGDAYVLGTITNIVDQSETTTAIMGDDLVDTTQEGGPFTVTYQVSDGTNTTTITETITVIVNEIDVFEVLSFTLINADTNEALFTIEEGMQIDINSLPTMHLDIRANTTTDVESVRFSLDGALSTSRTESLLPYALYQDLPIGDYKGNDFITGAYTVTAIPYTEDSLRGTMGSPFTINFDLIDSCQGFQVTLDVISEILSCGGGEGGAIVATVDGVAPISYIWSHDENLEGPIADGLTAGDYTVTATDANNCTAMLTLHLKDPELPEVSLLPFESVLDNEEPIVLIEGQPFGGSYSGEGVENGEFDPSIGKGTYEITYTYTDDITGCENSAIGAIEVISSEVLAVESFTLVNAETNEDLFDLEEGMVIDINSLPTLHLDIRANTSDTVESVKLSLSGAQNSARTESLVPYALFQDLPIGDYKGNDFIVGAYAVIGVPYSQDGARGTIGSSFQINFELVDPSLQITNFMLVNADTNEDLFLLEEGMIIDVSDLPTLHLDIRANTTDDVESVRLSLAGAITTARTESLVPYALFQDLPIGDYKGNDFIVGAYSVTSTPYSEDSLRGEKGSALTVNFEIVATNLDGKLTNQMIISPNPANDKTRISFSNATELKTLNIYDLHGRFVRTYTGAKVKHGDTYELEIKALQSGNYFIKAFDKRGNTFNGQLLIKKE